MNNKLKLFTGFTTFSIFSGFFPDFYAILYNKIKINAIFLLEEIPSAHAYYTKQKIICTKIEEKFFLLIKSSRSRTSVTSNNFFKPPVSVSATCPPH